MRIHTTTIEPTRTTDDGRAVTAALNGDGHPILILAPCDPGPVPDRLKFEGEVYSKDYYDPLAFAFVFKRCIHIGDVVRRKDRDWYREHVHFEVNTIITLPNGGTYLYGPCLSNDAPYGAAASNVKLVWTAEQQREWYREHLPNLARLRYGEQKDLTSADS